MAFLEIFIVTVSRKSLVTWIWSHGWVNVELAVLMSAAMGWCLRGVSWGFGFKAEA